MKGIFIAYDQAYNMDIANAMEKLGCRGFTMWQDIAGRGTQTGEPHLGNHAWPSMNSALISVMEDDQAAEFLKRLKQLDVDNKKQGLRAFAWSVTDAI